MSRKASFEKIPFKPTINNLSRKIVDIKRSTMTHTNSNVHNNIHSNINKK